MPTDKKFTGQRLDGTGLYYYNARYYDPLIGRFISPDTIIPDPSNPQSFNRYSYCLNNPLKYIDPNGHQQAEAAAFARGLMGLAGGLALVPGWGWIAAGGVLLITGGIILEQETGCFSNAWNNATSFFSKTKSDDRRFKSVKKLVNVISEHETKLGGSSRNDPNRNKWHQHIKNAVDKIVRELRKMGPSARKSAIEFLREKAPKVVEQFAKEYPKLTP